jgi:hypothetical protein
VAPAWLRRSCHKAGYITFRISNLIGQGLPCHGSRCRFESDLIRVLGYIVYIIDYLFTVGQAKALFIPFLCFYNQEQSYHLVHPAFWQLRLRQAGANFSPKATTAAA